MAVRFYVHRLYTSIAKWSTSLYSQETSTIEIEIQNQKGLFKENPKNRRTWEPWRLRTWKQQENLPETTVETLERDPSLLRNLDDVLGTTFGNWGMKALISYNYNPPFSTEHFFLGTLQVDGGHMDSGNHGIPYGFYFA